MKPLSFDRWLTLVGMLTVATPVFGVYFFASKAPAWKVSEYMGWCAVRAVRPLVTVTAVPLFFTAVTTLPVPSVVNDSALPPSSERTRLCRS